MLLDGAWVGSAGGARVGGDAGTTAEGACAAPHEGAVERAGSVFSDLADAGENMVARCPDARGAIDAVSELRVGDEDARGPRGWMPVGPV